MLSLFKSNQVTHGRNRVIYFVTLFNGNGRTSRLLINFELVKSEYNPIIIKNQDRARYYEVLDILCTTIDYEPLIRLV